MHGKWLLPLAELSLISSNINRTAHRDRVKESSRWFNVLEARLIESNDKLLGRFATILLRGNKRRRLLSWRKSFVAGRIGPWREPILQESRRGLKGDSESVTRNAKRKIKEKKRKKKRKEREEKEREVVARFYVVPFDYRPPATRQPAIASWNSS